MVFGGWFLFGHGLVQSTRPLLGFGFGFGFRFWVLVLGLFVVYPSPMEGVLRDGDLYDLKGRWQEPLAAVVLDPSGSAAGGALSLFGVLSLSPHPTSSLHPQTRPPHISPPNLLIFTHTHIYPYFPPKSAIRPPLCRPHLPCHDNLRYFPIDYINPEPKPLPQPLCQNSAQII